MNASLYVELLSLTAVVQGNRSRGHSDRNILSVQVFRSRQIELQPCHRTRRKNDAANCDPSCAEDENRQW
jgi:hypothetical protein